MENIEGEILEKDIKVSDADKTANNTNISNENENSSNIKKANNNKNNNQKNKSNNKNANNQKNKNNKKTSEQSNNKEADNQINEKADNSNEEKVDQINEDSDKTNKETDNQINEDSNITDKETDKKTDDITNQKNEKKSDDVEIKNTDKDNNLKPKTEEIIDNKEKLDIIKQPENISIINKIINLPKKKKIIIAVSCLSFIIILLLFSTIFALVNSNSDKIISGTYIKDIDVSGLTIDEAKEKLNKIINEKKSSEYSLYYGDYNTTLIPEQAEVSFDIDSSVKTAYERGRSNNIFADNYEIAFSGINKKDIIPSFTYNESFINNLISEMQENIPNKLIEPGYYIEDDNVIITKGIDGLIIDSDSFKLKFISSVNDFTDDNRRIEIPVQNAKAKDIDIEKIHLEVYKEPKDAYYTTNPFCVYPHEIGVDFAISVEEAKELLKENKESYSIDLAYTVPNITTKQIGSEAFPDLLADYSTTYSSSNVNRSTNIALASSKVDGTVLMPGEVFSYNATVGKRTPQAGFKSAAVYSGGQVTTDYGGGICQVSSTLYNAVLLSNLEIVERYNHGFNPGYVPAGRDATVSWGSPDFKFKNTRNYPIRIECSGTGGRIIAEIYGLKEENEYDVEIESYVTSYIPYKTIQQVDSSLETGETRVIESGSNGCRSVCYRILSQNGEEISRELLSSDTYNPHNRVIAVGP